MNTQTTTTPAKHTPGPWITSTGRVPGIGRALGVLKASHKPGEKGESICVVCKEDNTQPHDIANADLIAAAPELLAALRELLASVTCQGAEDSRLPIAWSGSPSQNHRMHAALKGARATLAKASGQNSVLTQPKP